MHYPPRRDEEKLSSAYQGKDHKNVQDSSKKNSGVTASTKTSS